MSYKPSPTYSLVELRKMIADANKVELQEIVSITIAEKRLYNVFDYSAIRLLISQKIISKVSLAGSSIGYY